MLITPCIAFPSFWNLFWAVYAVLAATTIGVIIHEKRDPVKAWAWIMVIALVPYVGMVIYVLFGRNHRKEKLFNRKEIKDLEQLEFLTAKQLREIADSGEVMDHRDVIENRDIITLLLNNNKALLTLKNRVTVLTNGKQTFAAIYDALRAATDSIHLEYYIFENDRVGRKVGRLLMEKARLGVEVRLIYDDVGSWGLSPQFIYKLKKAGVDVRCFMPVVFPWLTSKVNYRNHRKIIVVDGKVAFTGGINIAERYIRGTRFGPWRDTHLCIEGEGARMLQVIFVTDWYFVSKRQILNLERYFPEITVEEEVPLQIASSGPDSDWASIMQAFFAAINKAKEYIHITSPYFLPNQAILTALKVAALSGIDVSLVIPSRSDSKIVYWATRSYIPELLDAGIKVYFYRRGFNHSKVIIIDGNFSSVGTANMDIRSFEDNFEVSALIYDRGIAAQLEENFQKDLTHSLRVTPEMIASRPVKHNIYESLARLLSPLL